MQDNDLYCNNLPTIPRSDMGKILVTGATGYIGGRLIPELLARGYQVRAMVRAESPELEELLPEVEVVVADAVDKKSLSKALDDIDTAYYLIHSLLLGPEEFEVAEVETATNFREMAEEKSLSE